MLSILQRMYDLTPNNPVTIIEPVTVPCTSIDDIVPIGGGYLRHAFIVLQDADITVKNAAGNTIKRGTDYFTISRATDQAYSKQYSTSIYSGLKFKVTGTYTVTSFISCGTYPRAGWFNYLFEQFLTLRDVTVAALSTVVSTLRSDLNNMISTAQSTAASLSSLLSEYSNHAADTDIHITADERAKWNGKSKIYVVANISARNALSGLTAGDCAYVVNDGDGKRAEYMWTGSEFLKISDPDWENLSLTWANLAGIPANVTALVSAAGLTAMATALTVATRDALGKMRVATPIEGDNGLTVANKEWVESKVAASGNGDVSSIVSESTSGNFAAMSGTTGKLITDSGYGVGTSGAKIPVLSAANIWSAIQTFNARPAFNGGTTGTNSPFTVDSADVVANLNADLLDGHHASEEATANTLALRSASGELYARNLVASGEMQSAGDIYVGTGNNTTEGKDLVLLCVKGSIVDYIRLRNSNGNLKLSKYDGSIIATIAANGDFSGKAATAGMCTGNAATATGVTGCRRYYGTWTFANMASYLKETFDPTGTVSWTRMCSGVFWSSTSYWATCMYQSGGKIYMVCSSIADNYVICLTDRNENFNWCLTI